MIEIFTADGVSLDLDPAGAFEVEIEQPLLDDSHIPVPYSTSISFLPTRKNKSVFGFLDAMMFAPSVKKLSVHINVNSIRLFSGTLEYDGIEDGRMNYIFTGKNLEDEFQTYIHKVGHLTKMDGAASVPSLIRGIIAGSDLGDMYPKYAGDFGAPQILSAENITDIEFENNMNQTPVDVALKYNNWIWDSPTPFTPAVKVSSILSRAFSNFTIDPLFKDVYDLLAILGLHKNENSLSAFGIPYDGGIYHLDIADTLPNLTVIDLIKNVAKMLCASVFRDGEGYVFKSNKEIIESKDILDWDRKISDTFSASEEQGASYIFGYANDDSENTYDVNALSKDDEDYKICEVSKLYDVISVASEHTEYSAVRHAATGDMFSGKKIIAYPAHNGDSSRWLPFIDMLLHFIPKVEAGEDIENTYDNSVDFKCVRCMPIAVYNESFMAKFTMSPIVDIPAIGSDRQAETWIGLLINNQLVDKGITFSWPNKHNKVSRSIINDPATELPLPTFPDYELQEEDISISIAPAALYDKFHKPFAEWVNRNRQIITADVNLGLDDIANLRMYQKVAFRNRVFFIKKISFAFAVGSNKIETSADFIEC